MLCALIIASHMGGSLRDAEAVSRWATAARCEVRIEGVCASACTLLLASGCVTPDARLGFHGPSANGATLPELLRAREAVRTASHYPPRLARWYLAGPALAHPVHWLTGAEAVRLGAKPCKP